MILTIAKIIWLMMPAYFSTITPVIVTQLNFLNYPIDFKKKIFGKRIFGKNKTWRGLFFGTAIGILTAFIQFNLTNKFQFFAEISMLDYSNFLLIGFLLGFGGLFGDLIKSFIKRQLKIKPGISWFPFDQVDYSIGAIGCLAFYTVLPLDFIILTILVLVCTD